MTMREEAREIVKAYSAGSATYAFFTSPIPGTTVGVVAADAHMVYEIAKVYGYSLTLTEAVGTVGALLGAGTTIKTTLNEALTFIPFIGYVAKSIIAGGTSRLLGELAIDHFEDKYKKDRGSTT